MKRVSAGIVSVVSALAVVAAVSGAQPTAAAWSDRTVATAEVAAGSWVAPSWDTFPFTPVEETTSLSKPIWSIPATNGAGNTCAQLTVMNTGSSTATWSVLVAIDGAPYWGLGWSSFWGNGFTVSSVPGDDTKRLLTGQYPLAAGASVTIEVCTYVYTTPAPADPSFYTVATAPSGAWTGTSACVAVTVAGRTDLERYPFFYGWQAEVDLSAARAALEAAGGTLQRLEWIPSPNDGQFFTVEPHPSGAPDSYLVTSGQMSAIKGTQTYSLTACLRGQLSRDTDHPMTDESADVPSTESQPETIPDDPPATDPEEPGSEPGGSGSSAPGTPPAPDDDGGAVLPDAVTPDDGQTEDAATQGPADGSDAAGSDAAGPAATTTAAGRTAAGRAARGRGDVGRTGGD